jgi:hypothetical protein
MPPAGTTGLSRGKLGRFDFSLPSIGQCLDQGLGLRPVLIESAQSRLSFGELGLERVLLRNQVPLVGGQPLLKRPHLLLIVD